MRVRALTPLGEWTFGNSKGNYKVDAAALSQLIRTRLLSFIGDCFFAITEGIDWFNLLGGKSTEALDLAIRTTILNTEGVTGLLAVETELDEDRVLTISYQAQTVYGDVNEIFQLDVGQT